MSNTDPEDTFWKLAKDLYSDSSVKEGTMMGFKCLRVNDAFFATLDHKSFALVVKLPKEKVTKFIAQKQGNAFAPAGRAFKEWVSIPASKKAKWKKLMYESKEFVRSLPPK